MKKINKKDKIIKKENVLRETFGTHKFSEPIKQLMKEMDRELYDI